MHPSSLDTAALSISSEIAVFNPEERWMLYAKIGELLREKEMPTDARWFQAVAQAAMTNGRVRVIKHYSRAEKK